MPNIYDIAIGIVKSNPQFAESPMGQNFLEALENRDVAKGEEMANNVLKNNGLSKEEGLKDVQQNINSRIPNFPRFPFFR